MAVKNFSASPKQKELVRDPESLTSAGGSMLDAVQNLQPTSAVDQFTEPGLFHDTKIRPEVFSSPSGPAPFETLFHDFGLQATPHFNFWTSDEGKNDGDDLGDRKLEEVPRYVLLHWKTAPDLPDPSVNNRTTAGVRYRPIDAVAFTTQIKSPKVFVKNGVSFAPEHLGPDGFELVKGSTANGFFAPGTVEAVVELPGSTTKSPTAEIDEDVFLSDPAFAGVSMHELRAQAVAAVPFASSSPLSVTPDGKHAVQRSAGNVSIRNTTPSSPALGMSSKSAVPAKSPLADPVMSAVQSVTAPDDRRQSVQVKVKFFDPAVTGMLDQQKVNHMTAPEHVEALATLGPIMDKLQILAAAKLKNAARNSAPPSFVSPKIKPLEYIGYVIEKYQMLKSGVFSKVDEFDIPSREADTLVDTKVLYGATYRYRIRSYVRWTRPHSTETDQFGYPVVSQLTASRPPSGRFLLYQSTYFSSEWSLTWAYGSVLDTQPPPPPDELTVRPESHRQRIAVTCRLPDDQQLDISSMRVMRKTQGSDGHDTSDWVPVYSTESIAGVPANIMFFDYDTDFFVKNKTRYVYASQCLTRHGETSVLSEQIAARLNDAWKVAGELPAEFVSCAGVRPEYFGAFKTIPVRKNGAEIVAPPLLNGPAKVVLTGPAGVGRVAGTDASFVVRATSLDTGEHRDYDVSVVYNNLPPKFEPPIEKNRSPESFTSYARQLQLDIDSVLAAKAKKVPHTVQQTRVQPPSLKLALGVRRK